jgi:hypothetical protein
VDSNYFIKYWESSNIVAVPQPCSIGGIFCVLCSTRARGLCCTCNNILHHNPYSEGPIFYKPPKKSCIQFGVNTLSCMCRQERKNVPTLLLLRGVSIKQLKSGRAKCSCCHLKSTIKTSPTTLLHEAT